MLDVLIVGGGPVGLFLAALLAGEGLDLRVLERRGSPSGHSRAIGIHPPALEALEAIGIADRLAREAVRIPRGVVISRGAVLGEVRFDRVSSHYPFIGSLPQRRTEELLEQRLAELAPGALMRGAELVGLRETGASLRAEYALAGPGAEPGGTGEIEARFIIGADGARSTVRELAGVPAATRRYPDAYLMGDFPDGTPHGSTAVIHLEPGGVVESFPLPDGARRWVARTSVLAGDPTAEELAGLIRRRTGAVVDAGGNTMLSAFAVRRTLAGRTIAGRAILLGDAAHELSPIGGQGMNLGLLDAAALAPLLVAAARNGGAPVFAPPLAAYERSRRRSARTAAARAELNMALGRPLGPAAAPARDALLRAALATPLRETLARTFAMRGL